MSGSRAKVRRLLADPAVTVVVAGHRDRLGRMNTELVEAALAGRSSRVVVPGGCDVTGGLVGDMVEVLTLFCGRLYGRRSARNRALTALGCARQDIGPRAVKLQSCRGWCVSVLREIAEPFVVAPPAGVRVRTRLRVSGIDAAVLREVGEYLGSLASADLAARCAEGRLDAGQQARSRQVRKQELTAKSSSRWAGALTRTSEDAYQTAYRNLLAERRSLLARIKRIEARRAVAAGQRAGRVRGYVTAAERHAKTIRVQTLRTRLAGVERQLGTGRVSVCRGGKNLLRKRNRLADAGLTETQWRERWEASRMFLTADGEKAKIWGNETIRWNPAQSWLEIRLPTPLARLANRPSGRYRLSCPVAFTYRGGDVAAQAATGAVRYDIWLDPTRGRWYLDASWKTQPVAPVTLAQARHGSVVAVDLNAGHLAVALLDRHGNQAGFPYTISLPLAGLPVGTRDGRLRAAITSILATAREQHAGAVVIENLDFGDARDQGRERTAGRPARGRRGRAFRHRSERCADDPMPWVWPSTGGSARDCCLRTARV